MSKFKNIRIRAYLRTGVISDQYLPLDGVLYYHLVRREMGAELITKSRESNVREGANLTLPILKVNHKNKNPCWFYACSFAQWSPNMVESSSFKVKSGDWLRHSEHFKANKKINIAKGKFKNAHIKMYYRHAEYIDWYCVGIPEKIAELLQFCTHLGKNTGDGWGEVLRWEIDDFEHDWSVRGENNKLMRNVPLKQDGKGFVYGLRPSYWNPRHIFICKMP